MKLMKLIVIATFASADRCIDMSVMFTGARIRNPPLSSTTVSYTASTSYCFFFLFLRNLLLIKYIINTFTPCFLLFFFFFFSYVRDNRLADLRAAEERVSNKYLPHPFSPSRSPPVPSRSLEVLALSGSCFRLP